ncbi:MAG: glycosyltransferase family 2 protein [Rhodospirillales bacterium]|jgi:dolichol-phosphate mannosyltransferase|nr:glycosyltransferase family 2 protein [Rhodospirillales bacterium]MDP7242216.1 glycosyltransferase family 2 protein [Rhodospirillales bacterium]HJO72546.1 glycosyltransferase family 2 protein [Rhodospirillales bacterium]
MTAPHRKGPADADGSGSPELAIVVPLHDEAENIGSLVDEIAAALDGRVDYEIVYVDDGSDDDTPRRLRYIAARVPRLRHVRHRRRAGQSAAIATGVRQARAPIIATLDGDGQNDPGDIVRLLSILEKAGERDRLMVVGLRAKRQDSWLKRAASRVANAVRARLLKDGTPDTGCGLKVFTRAAFLEMPAFDHMHRFLPALMVRQGGSVVSVPVNHRARTYGISSYGVWDRLWVGIIDLLGVMWLQRRGSAPIIEDDDVENGGEEKKGR